MNSLRPINQQVQAQTRSCSCSCVGGSAHKKKKRISQLRPFIHYAYFHTSHLRFICSFTSRLIMRCGSSGMARCLCVCVVVVIVVVTLINTRVTAPINLRWSLQLTVCMNRTYGVSRYHPGLIIQLIHQGACASCSLAHCFTPVIACLHLCVCLCVCEIMTEETR